MPIALLLLLVLTLLVTSCTAAAPYVPTGSVLDVIMTNPNWSLLATAINTVLDPTVVQYLKTPTGSEPVTHK